MSCTHTRLTCSNTFPGSTLPPALQPSPARKAYPETTQSRHNHDTYAPGLRNDALSHRLEAQATQPLLALLDLCNLKHMLQADAADGTQAAVARRRMPARRLAHAREPALAVRARRVARATQLVLLGLDARGGQQQRCRGRRAQIKGEAAVWADRHAGWDRRAGDVVCCSCVEFLVEMESVSVSGRLSLFALSFFFFSFSFFFSCVFLLFLCSLARVLVANAIILIVMVGWYCY